MSGPEPPEVLVAGGGVAALEFVLAVRALAGDALQITVVAPDADFILRPALVRAPARAIREWRLPLRELADEAGFKLVRAAVAEIDAERARAITRSGDTLYYDSLVLAPGARTLPAFDDAVHLGDLDGARDLELLFDEIRGGGVERVAFVVPSRAGWILPVYEAALLTANAGEPVTVSLFTPERRPLEHFGEEASVAVAAALRDAGVEFIGGGRRFEPLTTDRVVSVPLIRGPNLPGVPASRLYGLIPVDGFGRVVGLPDAYAIGDATDYPVKQGAIACQQADVAAASIASRYGGYSLPPDGFRPELRATLLTGRPQPLLLNGGQGPENLPGRHLGPYLARRVGILPSPIDVQPRAPASA